MLEIKPRELHTLSVRSVVHCLVLKLNFRWSVVRSGGRNVMAACFASQPAGGRGRQVSLELMVKAPPVVAMSCSSTFEVILSKNCSLCLVICSNMEVKGQLVGIS